MLAMKLLIASGDDLLGDAIEEVLAARGITVFRARDSEEARRAVEVEELDIALVDEDLTYGGDCAAELLSQVRMIRPLVRRVLLTAGSYLEGALVDPSARRRAQGWLMKPIDVHQLDDVIASLTLSALRR